MLHKQILKLIKMDIYLGKYKLLGLILDETENLNNVCGRNRNCPWAISSKNTLHSNVLIGKFCQIFMGFLIVPEYRKWMHLQIFTLIQKHIKVA